MPDLNGANLIQANLRRADLRSAKLNQATLIDANLREARMHQAELSCANMRRTNLYRTMLTKACVRKANLTEAYLYNADLWCANLEEADLRDADMRFTDLNKVNLSGALLTGVRLYGSGREGWIIKDVKCEYVYWDEDAERRSPRDRYLKSGEFERIYAVLPTIEYIFENGMTPLDPLIMDRVVQAIRERQPELDIKIDSINARGLAPSVRFTVQHEEQKESALEQVQKEYNVKLKLLESERDRYYQLLARALDAPKEFKLISAGPGAIVATNGSTVNIQEHIHNAIELQKAIADEPEVSESFVKVAKKTAMDIVGGAIIDVAKGQVREAAKQIIELGKDLGPLFVRMAPAAYEFSRSIGA